MLVCRDWNNPHLPLVSERGVSSISIFNAFVKVVANDNTFIPRCKRGIEEGLVQQHAQANPPSRYNRDTSFT